MENFWYVAGFNEILIDIDRPHLSSAHTESRLLGAIECGKLPVDRIEIHASYSEKHLHCLVTLTEPVGSIERAVWSVMFHSDIYRGCATIMRNIYGIRSPDLLITPIQFLREPDCRCKCIGKHDAKTMNECGAAITLRGDDRCRGFFGLPSKSPEGIFEEYYERAHTNKQNFVHRFNQNR
jgi:hypothetical protein